jgi:hypothetical protein
VYVSNLNNKDNLVLHPHLPPGTGSGHAFWLFDEDHPVRVWVYDKITTSMYDYIMITIIMINCLGMALESPYVSTPAVCSVLLHA